jgi:hypothetical protein
MSALIAATASWYSFSFRALFFWNAESRSGSGSDSPRSRYPSFSTLSRDRTQTDGREGRGL